MTHLGTIIAGMSADVATKQARWLSHGVLCRYWVALKPIECNCEARSVIDLLLYIAERKAA
jgi:hypothetical protein